MSSPKVQTAHSASGAPNSLDAYPRPSVAVDIALLTTASHGGPPSLAVLLLRRPAPPNLGEWGLPGSMVRERERLPEAVRRTLAEKCGIDALEPAQLQVFDDPKRDDRGWVLSVAHLAVVAEATLGKVVEARDDLMLAEIASPTSVCDGLPAVALPDYQRGLPFDHDRIVALAVSGLRDRYGEAPDPAGLVAEPFTLLDLRLAHEAVLGTPLQKDTFRRRMMPGLEQVEGQSDGTVGRPARLYRRASASDELSGE